MNSEEYVTSLLLNVLYGGGQFSLNANKQCKYSKNRRLC